MSASKSERPLLTTNTTNQETLYHPIEESINWLHNVDDSTNNEYHPIEESINWLHNVDDSTNNEYHPIEESINWLHNVDELIRFH